MISFSRRAELLPGIDYPEENELGHYLQTSNPQAAAEIENPSAPPDVGTWVVFKDRAGVSRMHRTEFPALVLGADSDGLLSLMVVLEPEDIKMEDHVPFRSHNAENYYWRRVRRNSHSDASEHLTDSEVIQDNLRVRVEEIELFLRGEDKLGDIVEAIGKRMETVESVLASDEMEALEKRIAALESGTKPKAKRGRPAKAK